MPIGSLITSAARPSYGVASALTITSAAPAPAASPHSDAAGSTVSVDPIARNRSHRRAACSAREKTPGSSRACYSSSVLKLDVPANWLVTMLIESSVSDA